MQIDHTSNRRNFLRNISLAGTALSLAPWGVGKAETIAAPAPKKILQLKEQPAGTFWPDGIRMPISFSMQFEAGGEPDFVADSPFPPTMAKGYVDLPAHTWFQYGYKEGVPRMLDLWDEFGVKVTSHMIGEAVLKNPALAKEIVQRGHEAAAHGMSWTSQYNLDYDAEKKFIKDGVDAILKVTGEKALGYNANWLRRGVNTIKILQELGFTYHIDDLSRDEPFIIPANGKDFVVVPYTLRNNDIMQIEGRYFSTADFRQQLKDDFDQLYAESGRKRRMMSVSTHDRISGTPAMVQVWREFIQYASKHEGVAFMRKDAIAKFALGDANTIRETTYR